MTKIFLTLIFLISLCTLHAQVLCTTTTSGGLNGKGTISRFVPATNTFSSMFTFDYPDATYPIYTKPIQARDGKLYGLGRAGLDGDGSIIFSFDPITSAYTNLKHFDGINGADPLGSLMEANDGKLYGMASGGGAGGYGVIFSFDPITNTYAKLKDFDGVNGSSPLGSLMQADDGKLYGMTYKGGSSDYGVLFSYNIATGVYTKLKDFDYNVSGVHPHGDLIQASNGKLYGMTTEGGKAGAGTIFSFTPATAAYKVVTSFGRSSGGNPYGSLIEANDGKLYGMTYSGGGQGYGSLFSLDPATNVYTRLHSFDRATGSAPYGSLLEAPDGKLFGMTFTGGAKGYGVIFSFLPSTLAYTKLMDFDDANGRYPHGSLLQASNGQLYGMTTQGGFSGSGVLFSFQPTTLAYSKLRDFGPNSTGSNILGGIVSATNGKFYGMTYNGGNNGYGVVFSFDTSTSTYTKLIDFNGTDGRYPYGSLIQAGDGKLYGMTSEGGKSNSGVIFSYDISTSAFNIVKDFSGTNAGTPFGSLLQASNGKLYGMTSLGGNNGGYGVIFSFNPATSVYTEEFAFDHINGSQPYGSLIQAVDGKLYGMTTMGGSGNLGEIFSYDPATSTFTKLLDFDYFNNGAYPYGNLVQASNGKLYGMTNEGSGNFGVIFSFDPVTTTYTKLKAFDSTNGANPKGSLMQASDSKLYGMTSKGGSYNAGVAFSFNPATITYTKLRDFDGTSGNTPMYTTFIEVPPAAIAMKIKNVSLQEGNSGQKNMTFNVTLSAASSKTITVDYKTKDGTAKAPADYVAKTGTLTFAPGVKKQTISIMINGETQTEGDEKFKVLLGNLVNAKFADSVGVGTILNDDMSFTSGSTSVNEKSTIYSINVTPNPAASVINVQLNGYRENVTVHLMDMQGKILKLDKLDGSHGNEQHKFDVSAITSGTYFIVITEEGGNKQMKKVVISH